MTYELALQLNKGGVGLNFPLAGRSFIRSDGTVYQYVRGELPHATDCLVLILEELISACGDDFGNFALTFKPVLKNWRAMLNRQNAVYGNGSTPTEAVARLLLALQKHE